MNVLDTPHHAISPDPIPGFVQTRNGKLLNLLAPEDRAIDFDHIATTLAHQPMYVGRTEKFYSVAQHCVEVAKEVPHQYRLLALLSKAACAYMGDISPVREFFPEVAAAEQNVQRAVYRSLGLSEEPTRAELDAIRNAELVVQATEHRDLLPASDFSWVAAAGIRPLPRTIVPVRAERARGMFLATYHCTRCTDLLGDVSPSKSRRPA